MGRPDFVINQETGEEFATWSSSGVPPVPVETDPIEKPKKVSKKKKSTKKKSKKVDPDTSENEADTERREMAVNAFRSLFETTGIISLDDKNKALEIVCSDLRFDVVTFGQIEDLELEVRTLGELYSHLNEHKASIFESLFGASDN